MCTLWWFGRLTHCERIPTVQLINTPISLHISLFLSFWEEEGAFKFYCLSNFSSVIQCYQPESPCFTLGPQSRSSRILTVNIIVVTGLGSGDRQTETQFLSLGSLDHFPKPQFPLLCVWWWGRELGGDTNRAFLLGCLG